MAALSGWVVIACLAALPVLLQAPLTLHTTIAALVLRTTIA